MFYLFKIFDEPADDPPFLTRITMNQVDFMNACED